MRKKKINVHNQKSAYLFILPSMFILTVFVFIPLIASFIISLTNMNIFMNSTEWNGFGNFIKLLRDSRLQNAKIGRAHV